MITADTGTLAGVLAGDLVIVDPKTPPAFNDLVVVALDTGAAAIYRVQGAYLVPQGAGSFDALSLENSTVIGIARQVIRDIR
jgi:SOS-response transcriptional repressor LexA